jgi:hypothetical protein
MTTVATELEEQKFVYDADGKIAEYRKQMEDFCRFRKDMFYYMFTGRWPNNDDYKIR